MHRLLLVVASIAFVSLVFPGIAGFTPANALTDEMIDLGPAVGKALPHDLKAVDTEGNPQSFDTIKGKNGSVLVFFRSADWCPFCQRQLIDLDTIAKTVKNRGYSLVGISYDTPATLDKFKKRRNIDFTLLSDKGSEIIKAFNILNKTYEEGHFAHGVPHPIVFVVDENGIIQNKFFGQSYKERPETDVILSALPINEAE